MKITMLGTGALQYPLGFCGCDNCNAARVHKGKSIRKSASILINDDLIIDLSPDTPSAMNMYNKDMNKVKYLLQTHSHYDHYDPGLLVTRIPGRIDKKLNKLEIVAHPNCLKDLYFDMLKRENVDLKEKKGQEILNINIHEILSGEEITLGKYLIKAIETNHDIENGSILFLISFEGKNIFYATDTNELTNNALKQLLPKKLDLVLMDHTYGNVTCASAHLNEQLFISTINKMKGFGIVTDKTMIYGTHISHDGNSYHEEIEERAIKNGYHIAYDGMVIEI